MHEHGENCNCGHGHEHGEGCGCGHEHEHREIIELKELTSIQQSVLLGLNERSYLPVAQFTMGNSGDDEIYCIALAPVYMGSADDTLEAVKALGGELQALEDADLITLDYDLPLNGYEYREYTESKLFAYFKDTVRQGSMQGNALFDTAILETGSMALTERGAALAQALIDQ